MYQPCSDFLVSNRNVTLRFTFGEAFASHCYTHGVHKEAYKLEKIKIPVREKVEMKKMKRSQKS